MLKKVHIHNNQINETKCSICNTVTTSVLYVCQSGHAICKICQNTGKSNDDVDHIPEKDFTSYGDVIRLQRNHSGIKSQDLASGDHYQTMESHKKLQCQTQRRLQQSSKQTVVKDSNTKIEESKGLSPKICIEYKNLNYNDSKSSLITHLNSQNETINETNLSRPVICPVSKCSKIVPINSIIIHFYFDHSKVPRIILSDTEPCEFYLKPQDFLIETQCIATCFLPRQIRKSEVINPEHEYFKLLQRSYTDTKLLLLMVVKMLIHPPYCNRRHVSKEKFTKHVHTQTRTSDALNFEVTKTCVTKCSSDSKSSFSNILFEDDEVLLLWLCKFENNENVYSITLSRQDESQGFCYIGDAVHIRDQQDPSVMYDRSECLVVKGMAINNFLNNGTQMKVTINKLK